MDKGRIAAIAIAVGVVVFLLKLFAYFLSDSVALLSDAMESIINIVASILMFLAVRIAARPEDSDHRYGHQKAENISALIEGVLIIIAAVLIIEATIGRLFNPVPLENPSFGLAVSIVASSLNGALALLMLREAKKSHSMALEGDAKHLLSDVMSSVGVVIGLVIAVVTGLYILDPLIALIVALLLIKMGIDVFHRTTHDLMDASCEEEESLIIEVLQKDPRFLEYHDLKTRRSGSHLFMEVHICLDGDVTISQGQDIVTKLEGELRTKVPGIVPTIRLEDQTQCKGQIAAVGPKNM